MCLRVRVLVRSRWSLRHAACGGAGVEGGRLERRGAGAGVREGRGGGGVEGEGGEEG